MAQGLPDRENEPIAAWPVWLAGGFALVLLFAGVALWVRNGVEIYFTILLNGLALCF